VREVLRLPALLVAALLCAYPLSISDDQRVAMLTALSALAGLSALVLWSDGAVTMAAGAFAGTYACSLYVGDVGLDPLAPLYAAALVVFVEICDTGLAVPPLRPVDHSVVVALARTCAVVSSIAVVGAAVVLGASLALDASNTWLRILAMAGAAGAVLIPVIKDEAPT
jgi:hypothetical protein